jgi:hypothetical protein
VPDNADPLRFSTLGWTGSRCRSRSVLFQREPEFPIVVATLGAPSPVHDAGRFFIFAYLGLIFESMLLARVSKIVLRQYLPRADSRKGCSPGTVSRRRFEPFVRVQLTAPTASASAQSGRPFSAARREAEVQSYSSATKSAAHRPLRLVKMA